MASTTDASKYTVVTLTLESGGPSFLGIDDRDIAVELVVTKTRFANGTAAAVAKSVVAGLQPGGRVSLACDATSSPATPSCTAMLVRRVSAAQLAVKYAVFHDVPDQLAQGVPMQLELHARVFGVPVQRSPLKINVQVCACRSTLES